MKSTTGSKFWKVTTSSLQYQKSDMFKQPFNQATFINYDPNYPVTILMGVVIPPAKVITGGVRPSQFKINLNVGEVNTTNININIPTATTSANLVVIYTQYEDIE